MMHRSLLITALTVVLSIHIAAADTYSPPPNDPFHPLVVDIDNDVAPITTPLQTVTIKGNQGETTKTITGGIEVIKDINYWAQGMERVVGLHFLLPLSPVLLLFS
jgi:hypothetical protein